MTKAEIRKVWSGIRERIFEEESRLQADDPIRRELFQVRSLLDRREEHAWAHADKEPYPV